MQGGVAFRSIQYYCGSRLSNVVKEWQTIDMHQTSQKGCVGMMCVKPARRCFLSGVTLPLALVAPLPKLETVHNQHFLPVVVSETEW